MLELFNIIRKAYHRGKFKPRRLISWIMPIIYGLRYTINDPASKYVTLHCPNYIKPEDGNDEKIIVERIFQSFKKIKKDQDNVSQLYRPSPMWQEHLDNDYSYLNDALKNNDLNKFHFFLSNFGTWRQSLGIENNHIIRHNMKSRIRRKYMKNIMFDQQLKTWQWFYNNSKPISQLSYPAYGNQSGAFINNEFVGIGSFFNEIYGSILNGLIDDIKRPIVADLGAGYGKLAYFILRDIKSSCFIDYDLPEPLCLAAYYLMKTWPDKKTLLYGEEKYSILSHNEYDLIFMPSSEISKVSENSIDLFINVTSLGEMTKETVINYIDHITRSTRYFWHMNHDIFPIIYSDNSRGLLGNEYPIPTKKFKLLFRYPDLGHLLYKGGINWDMDLFFYLYERRK